MAAVWLAGAPVAAPSAAAVPAGRAGPVLEVPFVAQDDHLCGGACLAMLRRYWGERGVYARDFARDLDSPAGITTPRMARAASRAGYETHAFAGTIDLLRHHLARGRPLIILIDAPGARLHYVVVAGVSDSTVTCHDPAQRPSLTMSLHELETRWRTGGYWTLLVTPRSPGSGPPSDPDPPAATGADPDGLTAEAVRSFRSREWTDAEMAAQAAVANDPRNPGAWQILGASRYMQSRRDDALAAWNHVDAPLVDLVQVHGLERTRHDVVVRALGPREETVLTTDAVRLARRRLSLVPSIAAGRVDYRPVATGVADVEVAVVERAGWSPQPSRLAVAGARALAERTVRASVSSPTGGGEVIEASYRWWENRPRAALELATPSLFGLQGLTRAGVALETQTYATGDGADTAIETTREGTLGWTQYLSPSWRLDTGAGLHHIRERGRYASADAGLALWLSGDRLRLHTAASGWRRIDAREPLHLRLDAGADYRARLSASFQIDARAGWSSVDTAAPRLLWPGAGTGEGRPALLRAHPLLDDGVVDGVAFSPSLATAGLELTQWLAATWLGAALFLDGASTLRARDDVVADAGFGLRLHPPGARGQFRLDVAVGVSEPARAVSFVWQSTD